MLLRTNNGAAPALLAVSSGHGCDHGCRCSVLSVILSDIVACPASWCKSGHDCWPLGAGYTVWSSYANLVWHDLRIDMLHWVHCCCRVPQKAAVQEPAGPKIDPLGRNAAAAAAAASKAAKKNAKRAAAKQQRREQTTAADGSISDTSSMAESGAVASVWSTDAGGAAGGRDSNAGDAGEDWDDGEGYDLDADQLLLLELLKKQRGKQPHELLSFAHSDTTRADSSSEEEEHEEEQQHEQQHEQQPVEAQQQYPAAPPGFQQQQQSVMQQHQHATWAPQQQFPHQQLPLQASSVSALPAGIDVSGLQQQLAASSISAPHFPAHPQHLGPPMQPPQQPYPTQQQFPASVHSGLPCYSHAGGGYVGPGYSGAGLVPQQAVPVPLPTAAPDGEEEDYSTDELLALLMGG